jgi:hypothetical protein
MKATTLGLISKPQRPRSSGWQHSARMEVLREATKLLVIDTPQYYPLHNDIESDTAFLTLHGGHLCFYNLLTCSVRHTALQVARAV